ncbi:MAG: hypothetical protein AB8H86_28385 [Polyangiales bacterium]
MAVEGELSLEEEAKALRKGTTKGRRLLLFAFVGHVLILAALVGLPYLRGRRRAEVGKQAFARYAACLLGGEATDDPGLALPDDAPEHYADEARKGRLLECRGLLQSLAPDDVFWLFPSTRHAEGEVRRAVAMATRELEAVDDAPVDRTPERPWLALQRVIAALTLWSEAADVQGNIFDHCVRFSSSPRSARAERVPLQAAPSAALEMRTHAEGVAVLALDARGISWVRVAAGALDPRRMRRQTLIRDVRFHEGQPWIIWATPEERCEGSCAQRSMGAAWLQDSTVETPEPRYLRAHPAGSIPSSVQISDDFLWVAARRETGVAVVRFARSALSETVPAGSAGEEPGPLAGETVASPRSLPVSYLVRGAADALWGIDDDSQLVDGSGLVRARNATWLMPAGDTVFAGISGGVARLRGTTSEQIEVPPLTERSVAFDSNRSALGGIADDTLHIIRCDVSCETISIPAVSAFRVAFLESGLLIAHSAGGEIRVQVWDEDSLSAPRVPAPCWSESGGFCAPMAMTARSGRVVLGGRDGQDILVVETRDGEDWIRLVGLR